MVNAYIRNIKIASKNGKLTFFVGAGLSKLSDYPDWKELTHKFSSLLCSKGHELCFSLCCV